MPARRAGLGDNGVSTVKQSNTLNEATVDQTGSMRGGDSTIDRTGTGNTADVAQGPGATSGRASGRDTVL